jgi:hypothetical protein
MKMYDFFFLPSRHQCRAASSALVAVVLLIGAVELEQRLARLAEVSAAA